MNGGAFGENFPYSNFHDLNMDWIIKIAKDFLDQYTHIQEVIADGEQSLQNLTTSGLQQLQQKADALEALLQQWYNTHSQDIANQLADALEDLNDWYTTHQNYLDQTLAEKTTVFNNRADAKTLESIASIPADYSNLAYLVKALADKLVEVSPNMFNSALPIITDKWMSQAGWQNNSDPTNGLGTTYPMFVRQGVEYKCNCFHGLYGDNSVYIVYVNPTDLSIIGGSTGTYDSATDTLTWTATQDGYVVKDIDTRLVNTFTFTESKNYSNTYYEYSDIKEHVTTFTPNDGYGISKFNILTLSPNLFNINRDMIHDRWMSQGGWVANTDPATPQLGTTYPMYVHKGVTYKMKCYHGLYGVNGEYVVYVNPTDLSIIGGSQGTYDEETDMLTWTATGNGYVVKDIDFRNYQTFMFCTEDTYPDYFIPYNATYLDAIIKLNPYQTPLGHKTLVCDGDSIADATYDLPKNLDGWYGRLVAYSTMNGYGNYAIGGGTITAGLYYDTEHTNPRHWICRSIDNIHRDHPNAQYVILSGGTNDADIIGQFVGDTPPAKYGTWNATDFSGNYDDETFCGAVESLFYKALTMFPNAKIGFIIEMEMGTNSNSVTNRKRYLDEIEMIAQKWHIPTLNLWTQCPADARLTTYYDPNITPEQNVTAQKFYYDGQHPTSYGYDKMQNLIVKWLETL